MVARCLALRTAVATQLTSPSEEAAGILEERTWQAVKSLETYFAELTADPFLRPEIAKHLAMGKMSQEAEQLLVDVREQVQCRNQARLLQQAGNGRC